MNNDQEVAAIPATNRTSTASSLEKDDAAALPTPPTPPDGGLVAWLQVFSSFLINVNNWGLVYSFGVFQEYYSTTFLAHKSVASIAWIGTIQGSFLLIFGFLSGPLFDLGYPRVMFLGGAISLVFSVMMLSLCTEFYQVILTQGVLFGISSGMLYVPSVAAIPQYFTTKRGAALALGTGGGSIGGVIYPIVFRRLLTTLGFPWAVRIIGFLGLATLGMAGALMRPLGSTKKPARKLFDTAAATDVPFLAFAIAGCFLFAGILIPFFLASSYATSVHASQNTAYYLVAVINGAQFLGRIFPGVLSDHLGPEIMMLLGCFAIGILGLVWIAIHNLPGYIAFLAIYGFFSGAVSILPAAVIPYLCPSLAVYGTRVGMVYGMAGVGILVGAPCATAAASHTGGFLGAQVWMGVVPIVGAVIDLVWSVPGARKSRLAAAAARMKAKDEAEAAASTDESMVEVGKH